MRNILTSLLIAFAFSLAAHAQRIEKPTLTPKECTEPQRVTIRDAVKLHDAKRYPDAVSKYQQVLTENPDCTLALYELSFTYYAMGEKTNAMETAYKGSRYQSDHLPLFYLTMANVIDDAGKPDEAVKIYRDAIKMLEGGQDTRHYLSSLHYNLGLTLVRQKKNNDARVELKHAVEYNYQYGSPHYLLAVVYNSSKYKVPAFLAAARFLSLEFSTRRSEIAAEVIREVLAPAQKDAKTGNVQIFVDMNSPKDEGDFAMFELFLGTLTTVRGKGDEKKTEDQMFVDAVSTLIALVSEKKELRSTFVGKNYVPFVAELKKKGYAEVLAFLVLHHGGSKDATAWLGKNETKLIEFVEFSKSYSLPK